MSSLTISRQLDDGRQPTRLAFRGDLTEDAKFDEARGLSGQVFIDLSGISRINSSGVREWMDFVTHLPKTAEVVFECCSPAFVSQAGMIANFLGPGRIASVMAPYLCEACERPQEHLLTVGHELVPDRARAPARNCDRCGKPLVFDDLEQIYFRFLANTPAGSPGIVL